MATDNLCEHSWYFSLPFPVPGVFRTRPASHLPRIASRDPAASKGLCSTGQGTPDFRRLPLQGAGGGGEGPLCTHGHLTPQQTPLCCPVQASPSRPQSTTLSTVHSGVKSWKLCFWYSSTRSRALWLSSVSLRAISWASRGILHQAGITQLISRWPTTLLRAPQRGFCYSQVPKKWVEAASSRLFGPKRCSPWGSLETGRLLPRASP